MGKPSNMEPSSPHSFLPAPEKVNLFEFQLRFFLLHLLVLLIDVLLDQRGPSHKHILTIETATPVRTLQIIGIAFAIFFQAGAFLTSTTFAPTPSQLSHTTCAVFVILAELTAAHHSAVDPF